MSHADLWRLKDGKLIEHWDGFNLLESIPANRARRRLLKAE
jgi:predicted SnoaL-like aldol condensation-catalyzing enzyme